MTESNEVTASRPAKRNATRAVDMLAETMRPTRTVVYKQHGAKALRFHIFEPPEWRPNDARACFLILHGGSWRGGSPHVFYPVANYFAKRGMLGISMEYSLVGEDPPFHCVHDGRSAVRYLKSHAHELGIDPNKIVVSGGSAGGHVAVGTALFDGIDAEDDDLTISTVPAALVLYYPVIDTSAEGYGHVRCGPRWQELSPAHRVKPDMPPTLVFHGTGDTVTPFKGAQRFHKEMLKADNHCELIPYENGIHGYFLYDLALFEQALKKTDDFLTSHHLLEPHRAEEDKGERNG